MIGGGGGGRDTMAQAGGKDADEARRGARAARAAIEAKLDPELVRVLALDYGSARCGCALSDPTGMLATPLDVIADPGSERGLGEIARLVASVGRSGWSWGCR